MSAEPGEAEAFNLAAVCSFRLNRRDVARAYWQRTLAVSPDHAGACINLANLFSQTGQHDEARAMYRKVLDIEPDSALAHFNLGLLLRLCNQPDEAESALRNAIRLQPGLADAHHQLGMLLAATDRPAEAELTFRRALELRPDWAPVLRELGTVLHALGRAREAELVLRHATQADPNNPIAHHNLASLLAARGQWRDAEQAYRRAIDLDPTLAHAHSDFAVLLSTNGRFAEAEAHAREALGLAPANAIYHNNLANALRDLGQAEEAESAYRRAIDIEPGFADARFNLALHLLSLGAYAEGWALHEARYDERKTGRAPIPPELAYPQWRDEPLSGKSIVVLHEQGFGDTLQFCRYLPMLKAQGAASLTVVCHPHVAELISSLDGVDRCIERHELALCPAHDYWCFMMSLPLHFGTTLDTIPHAVPYLRVPEARRSHWRARLPGAAPKVGLVWAGNPRQCDPEHHALDRRRSMQATDYLPLLQAPDITFVSLQIGAWSAPQLNALPPDLRPFDPTDEVRDFADTAAIIECLDLVVTVDTSVAHLAGALGKPVWILSRIDGCWRWLREREDSPWYPTARLFHQRTPDDWTEAVERVAHALRAWRAGFIATRP
ncbi:tetratricopeptide repeat protein [Caballeronia hypogeia]|uniref:tetratricopeptide repeat protein n=1 Tax=Caballeronia hypogeia TaxID=1777140 RepID=UPI000940BBA0|nr:tetratricopeptide repeat protein [Caballeronia hypogeia]